MKKRGWTPPRITCAHCGETKNACLYFPKLRQMSHLYKPSDARLYGIMCKRCIKPRPENAPADWVASEVQLKGRKRGPKKKKKVKKPRVWKNKELSAQLVKERRARTRVATRVKSMQYLSQKGCETCGERDPRKLEYDHKSTLRKYRNVSRLIIDGFSWSSRTLRNEIRRCRVLCANCHRVHTIKQQGYYASDDVQAALGAIAGQYNFEP